MTRPASRIGTAGGGSVHLDDDNRRIVIDNGGMIKLVDVLEGAVDAGDWELAEVACKAMHNLSSSDVFGACLNAAPLPQDDKNTNLEEEKGPTSDVTIEAKKEESEAGTLLPEDVYYLLELLLESVELAEGSGSYPKVASRLIRKIEQEAGIHLAPENRSTTTTKLVTAGSKEVGTGMGSSTRTKRGTVRGDAHRKSGREDSGGKAADDGAGEVEELEDGDELGETSDNSFVDADKMEETTEEGLDFVDGKGTSEVAVAATI
ncbi:hypothetical protein HK102_003961 [Quaeritorhiza haematococci]|nr:hypothetical protein HK102_003961 [Quaeritorhiza haematococci]